MIRSALTAAAFLALSAPAFATTFTFETAEPVKDGQVVAIGTVWLCEGTVCKGDLDRKKASVRDCKKIAKILNWKLTTSSRARNLHANASD